MRYSNNAVAWLIHDTVIHPFTGALGLIGRATGSLRLMTLALHIHNATAPSNDVLADYAQAEALACHNETRDNPMGSMTPDELEWRRRQVATALGEKPGNRFIPDDEAERVMNKYGLDQWDQQREPGESPEFTSRESALGDADIRLAERELKAAHAALKRFDDHKLGGYQTRNLREELRGWVTGVGQDYEHVTVDGVECVGVAGLRAEREKRERRVQYAKRALARVKAGTRLGDILGEPQHRKGQLPEGWEWEGGAS